MKFITPSLVHLEKKELLKLCMQVKETLATDIKFNEKKKVIVAADLWSLRKTMKTAARLGSNRARIQSLV